MKLVNLAIMKRWENWVTIFLMLVIASFAVNALSKLVITNGVNQNAS